MIALFYITSNAFMTRNKIKHHKSFECLISVYINEPTWNQLDGTMQITCTVLGLTEIDALLYEIELHRRRNYNITRLVKSTPSNLDQTDNKYYWNNVIKDKITGKYRATVHLQVNSKYMYIIFIPLISSLRL